MNGILLAIGVFLVVLIFFGLKFGFILRFESEHAYKTIVFKKWTFTIYYKVKPEYLEKVRQEYPDFPEEIEKRIF